MSDKLRELGYRVGGVVGLVYGPALVVQDAFWTFALGILFVNLAIACIIAECRAITKRKGPL